MNIVYFLMQQTFFFMIPLLVVALGGMFSERSGIINIALDGKMLLGAFTSIFFINRVQNSDIALDGQLLLILALLIAAATGVFVALFHAYASISLNANQIISGVAINMVAPAFAIYTARIFGDTQQVFFNNTFRIDVMPGIGNIPFVGDMFFTNTYLTTYLGFVILLVSAFVLYKTKFGIRLRACGEHPQAADSVGVNVYRIRYAGVLISGALAGMGGLILIIPTTVAFNATVSGYGFLALAVLIFGAWRPWRILFAAFFFGLLQAIAAGHTGIGFLRDLGIPMHFYQMVPYAATLVVLAFTSGRTQAPKAAGVPYDKGKR